MYLKRKHVKQPEISTASLPDIIFLLLFFFMITTQFNKLGNNAQKSIDIEWIKRFKAPYKNIANQSILYVGFKPKSNDVVLVADNQLFSLNNITNAVQRISANKNIESIHQPLNLAIDAKIPMEIVTKIKTALLNQGIYKIQYLTSE